MKKVTLVFSFILSLMSCSSSDESEVYTPVPYELEIPQLFQEKLIAPVIPASNPLTQEGVALGKKLFFDRILSGDGTQSCASCHNPKKAFTDGQAVSVGIEGIAGNRNAMPLFNLAWNFDEKFSWDGKDVTLEQQALDPVSNPIELHGDWKEIAERMQNHPEYPLLFQQAFGVATIDSTAITKALAQFQRTLISGNSKFDRYVLGLEDLTPEEQNGFNAFMDEARGDCFHCHGSNNNPLWTDNLFHNNGLDREFDDLGLGVITGDPADYGKFKTPSLRNLIYTAPYMHDGRFNTLEEVINHYSEGLQASPTIDPLMKKVNQGGAQLSEKDKADLKAFLLTLTDEDFINNPKFQK